MDQLAQQLDTVDLQLALAKQSLAKGDYPSVLTAVSIVKLVVTQIEDTLSDVTTIGPSTNGKKPAGAGGPGRPPTKDSDALLQHIVRIMEKREAVTLRELGAALEAEGISLPGEGKPANLISYLRRIPRVVRLKRGVYSLQGQ